MQKRGGMYRYKDNERLEMAELQDEESTDETSQASKNFYKDNETVERTVTGRKKYREMEKQV